MFFLSYPAFVAIITDTFFQWKHLHTNTAKVNMYTTHIVLCGWLNDFCLLCRKATQPPTWLLNIYTILFFHVNVNRSTTSLIHLLFNILCFHLKMIISNENCIIERAGKDIEFLNALYQAFAIETHAPTNRNKWNDDKTRTQPKTQPKTIVTQRPFAIGFFSLFGKWLLFILHSHIGLNPFNIGTH